MREFITVAKALADENRVRALMFLGEGELCLCQIIEMLSLAPSTVSKHMAVLYQAGLVEVRKGGRWTYYRLAEKDAPRTVKGALQWVRDSLVTDRQVREDARRLRTVLRKPLKELCQCYEKS